jgi:glycine/D-amino acid oxidase-like deaminating enzyme
MTRTGQRAVVAGTSMSGLLTARVLTEAFDRVTVVDRDELPREITARRGRPRGGTRTGCSPVAATSSRSSSRASPTS